MLSTSTPQVFSTCPNGEAVLSVTVPSSQFTTEKLPSEWLPTMKALSRTRDRSVNYESTMFSQII